MTEPVDRIADEVIRDDVAKHAHRGRPGKGSPRRLVARKRPRLILAGAVVGLVAVVLVALAVSGVFGGNSSRPVSLASNAPLLKGGDGTQRFIYWQGYATSSSGCSSPVPTGPSATTNYAGNMWLSKGVLYASGIEFSGNFKGVVHADGTFKISTPVTPGYASTFAGHIAPHGDTGLFNGTYSNRVSGPCFVHGVMSGHVGLTNGGFGPGARISGAKP